jgi:hypothetical protein
VDGERPGGHHPELGAGRRRVSWPHVPKRTAACACCVTSNFRAGCLLLCRVRSCSFPPQCGVARLRAARAAEASGHGVDDCGLRWQCLGGRLDAAGRGELLESRRRVGQDQGIHTYHTSSAAAASHLCGLGTLLCLAKHVMNSYLCPAPCLSICNCLADMSWRLLNAVRVLGWAGLRCSVWAEGSSCIRSVQRAEAGTTKSSSTIRSCRWTRNVVG